jgi:indolepyruvate ferredoxin oxidoreductase
VVTISALLATAAWIEGLSVATLDQTGTAQKGGAVVSHLLLSDRPIEAPAKVNAGNADLILGFDILGVTSRENLKTARAGHTAAVINTDLVPTIDVIRSRLPLLGSGSMLEPLNAVTDRARNIFIDANRLAENLFGSHMAVNIFLTGVAWQAGLIPISLASIEKAVELNGVEKDRNLRAFTWGRKYHEDPQFVERQIARPDSAANAGGRTRTERLRDYQNQAYADKYEAFLETIEDPALREVVGRYLYKLMAYKDEYEVARLLTDPSFEQNMLEMWEAPESVSYNLHPPLLRRFGVTRKMKLGPWFRYPLLALARFKFLRGTPFDLFGYAPHRRKERELIHWYRGLIQSLQERLTPDNLEIALEIAALPEQIRGYEQIKERSIGEVRKLADEKLGAMQHARLTVAT